MAEESAPDREVSDTADSTHTNHPICGKTCAHNPTDSDQTWTGISDLQNINQNGSYYLILRKADSTAEQFNKVCNILSEYADIGRFTPGLDAHFAEHMETIIAEQALQKLSSLA